jgi:hypothetical protein
MGTRVRSWHQPVNPLTRRWPEIASENRHDGRAQSLDSSSEQICPHHGELNDPLSYTGRLAPRVTDPRSSPVSFRESIGMVSPTITMAPRT